VTAERCGAPVDVVGLEDPPDRGGSDTMAETDKFAVDAEISQVASLVAISITSRRSD